MLPSFAVAAELLCFIDYADGIKYRLTRLSLTTRMYYVGHNEILKTFLIERPLPIKNPLFGEYPYPLEEEFEPDQCSEFEFPSMKITEKIMNRYIETGSPMTL